MKDDEESVPVNQHRVRQRRKVLRPKARNISSLLSNVDAVRSCYVVVGAYQIIAEIETDGLAQIGKFINDNITAIPGVDRCTVCLVLDGIPDKQREELAVGEIA